MGLFKSAPYRDPDLGLLHRSWGCWKGTIALGGNPVGLRLSGGRKAPDPRSVELARELPRRFEQLKPEIPQSLFDHYDPYKDAHEQDELPARKGPFPSILDARGVWQHVEVVEVTIEPLQGSPAEGPVIEIAYRTAWDEEHTLGARVQGWRLFELCGSV